MKMDGKETSGGMRGWVARWWVGCGCAGAVGVILGCAGSAEDALVFETAAVTRGDLVQYVTASGSLSAVVSVDVGSQVSGKVAALRADFNSPVKKGEVVAEIDTSLYAAALRQSQGELASARADVVLKRQNLERKKTLVPLRAASTWDLEQATAELAKAEAAVLIREAVVESAQANLGYCKITAPVDGIVIARRVDAGQTVIAAMTTPVLFVIAQDITKMNISAAVSEADIGQVRVGQPVEFTVDAYPDEVFAGVVEQVRKAPASVQNVVTYDTIIRVSNPEQKLFPGMTADVSIRVAERTGVWKVANAALRYSPPLRVAFESPPPLRLERAQRLVFEPSAPSDSRLRPHVVRVGISDGVETELLEGGTAGLALVVASALAPQSQFSWGRLFRRRG
jgi:HlyD family secretion protein